MCFSKISIRIAKFCILSLIILTGTQVTSLAQSSSFECDDEFSEEECQEEREFDIWWEAYEEQYGEWHDQLLFNRDIYFWPYEGERFDEERIGTNNMVDAHYSIALRRYSGGWAFAVNGHQLRAVSFKTGEDLSPEDLKNIELTQYPKSISEAANYFKLIANWREVDLRTCSGAIKQLKKFPGQSRKIPLWDSRYLDQLEGKKVDIPDEITLTMDGSGVHIRAKEEHNPETCCSGRGQAYIVFDDRNGGYGSAWAHDMYEIIEPCLVPTMETAPWDKITSYHTEND